MSHYTVYDMTYIYINTMLLRYRMNLALYSVISRCELEAKFEIVHEIKKLELFKFCKSFQSFFNTKEYTNICINCHN